MASAARAESFLSSRTHQTKVWLSKRIVIRSFPEPQLLFRERIEEERIRNFSHPLEQAWLALELAGQGGKPDHRVLAACNDDLFAGFRAGDELRKLGLGFVVAIARPVS